MNPQPRGKDERGGERSSEIVPEINPAAGPDEKLQGERSRETSRDQQQHGNRRPPSKPPCRVQSGAKIERRHGGGHGETVLTEGLRCEVTRDSRKQFTQCERKSFRVALVHSEPRPTAIWSEPSRLYAGWRLIPPSAAEGLEEGSRVSIAVGGRVMRSIDVCKYWRCASSKVSWLMPPAV